MPLIFSHSALVWFLPAIALPILFHLFFRLKRQVRDFPTLMFFQRIDPRLSAKRKIHEWLILLLRSLFIALVLLALMRPKMELGSGSGATARIILIDNSASMSTPGKDGFTKLQKAGKIAQQLVSSSQPGDAVAVQLMIPDAQASLPGDFHTDTSALHASLEKLPSSDASSLVPKALREALARFTSVRQSSREIHVITDLQKTRWSRGELEAQAGQNVRIVIHRIDSPSLSSGWVSLAAVEQPHRAFPTGRTIAVKFSLKNHGPTQGLVRLNSTDDSGKNFSRDMAVAPGGNFLATPTFSFSTAGFHWARVWLEGDAAAGANSATLGFWCTDARKTLFLGNLEKYGALPYAVSPGGNSDLSGIQPVPIQADKLLSELATKPLALCATWESFPQDTATVKGIENYVREGGMLFVAPSPGTEVQIGNGLPPWMDISTEAPRHFSEGESIIALQANDRLWKDLRGVEGEWLWGKLQLFHSRPLNPGADWQSLLASSSGSPLLARKALGRGTIFASGIAFTPKWSSLPLKAAFVVLVQGMFFSDSQEAIPVRSLDAGADVVFDSPKLTASVRSLTGDTLAWQGMPSDFGGLPRTGVFETMQNNSSQWVAVSASAGEAEQEFFAKSVPLLKNVSYEVVSTTGDPNSSRAAAGQHFLYGWLLLAAALVLLLETWLSNERSGDFGRKLFEGFTTLFRDKKREEQP